MKFYGRYEDLKKQYEVYPGEYKKYSEAWPVAATSLLIRLYPNL